MKLSHSGGGALSLPLGGRWHGAAQRRSVTDEGSPLSGLKCGTLKLTQSGCGEGAKVARRIKDINAGTEGEIHRVCAKAVDIDKRKGK